MNEPWETSIYPIVKNHILENTDEDKLSDKECETLANKICQAIDKKYVIEKRQV